jgi:hypothetical protein
MRDFHTYILKRWLPKMGGGKRSGLQAPPRTGTKEREYKEKINRQGVKSIPTLLK